MERKKNWLIETDLEEGEMDEEEDEGWSAEPEVGVADLHQRYPLDHRVPLRDVDRHPADDPLQLRPHRQDRLPLSPNNASLTHHWFIILQFSSAQFSSVQGSFVYFSSVQFRIEMHIWWKFS